MTNKEKEYLKQLATQSVVMVQEDVHRASNRSRDDHNAIKEKIDDVKISMDKAFKKNAKERIVVGQNVARAVNRHTDEAIANIGKFYTVLHCIIAVIVAFLSGLIAYIYMLGLAAKGYSGLTTEIPDKFVVGPTDDAGNVLGYVHATQVDNVKIWALTILVFVLVLLVYFGIAAIVSSVKAQSSEEEGEE